MRLIASFFLGFMIFFFLGDLLYKRLKLPLSSAPGLIIILSGFIIGIWGRQLLSLYSPLDVFVATFVLGSGLGLTFYHLLSKRHLISERIEHAFIRRHESAFERGLEMVPGFLTWTVLTSPFWLSFTLPFAVAYLLIIADVYWLTSALKNALLIFLGYRKVEWVKKQPWLEMLKKDFSKEWENYSHLILLPRYNEGLLVIGPAIDAAIHSNFPKEKIFLSIGLEERQKVGSDEIKQYIKKYVGKIGGIFITEHPPGLEGEIPGPATNRNWMVRNAVKQFEKMKIDPKKVLVTTLDVDFVIHKEFLSGALHKYLSSPENIRDKRSYTGSFMYYNNYWQTPAPMRMIAVGTAFWQLSEMLTSDKYQNFSSMTINLKSLLDIGLWIPNKVNDDSGFYWKAYFHFDGNYKVIPHFLPINGDAVLDVNLIKTIQNQYLQLKRWAYGVEHFPFILKQYFKRTDIDFWDKTDKLLFFLWGNTRWGTLSLFVTFGGLLIPLINPNYKQSVIAVNLPIISSWILTAAFIGLLATIYVHEKTVPPRPKNWNILHKIWSYLQFLLVPIIVVTISAIPSIDAQTRLMFGRYMEFRTTNKARKENVAFKK